MFSTIDYNSSLPPWFFTTLLLQTSQDEESPMNHFQFMRVRVQSRGRSAESSLAGKGEWSETEWRQAPRRHKKRRQERKTFERKAWFPFLGSVRFTKSSEGRYCPIKGSGPQRVLILEKKNKGKVEILFLIDFWNRSGEVCLKRSNKDTRSSSCNDYKIKNG